MYVSNSNEKDLLEICNSSFTYFYTRNKNYERSLLLLSKNNNNNNNNNINFNHILLNESSIGKVSIVDSCFDINEFLLTFNQPSLMIPNDHPYPISSSLVVDIKDNNISETCFYPEIVDKLIVYIGEIEDKFIPTSIVDPGNSWNRSIKKLMPVIISVVVGVIVIVIIIVTLVVLKKKKKDKNPQTKEFDDNSEELCQEYVDIINTKYDKMWSNFASKSSGNKTGHTSTQDGNVETNQNSDQSCDDLYEESKWDNFV